jgi:putative membrane protein
MKTLLRYFLINLVALWATTQVMTGLSYTGGVKTLLIGVIVFTAINFVLVPLLKVLLLPLNLLTLGFFAWLTNVLALYALTNFVPQFRLTPYSFAGVNSGGFIIPAVDLSTLWVAIIASLLIGAITHFLQWLVH